MGAAFLGGPQLDPELHSDDYQIILCPVLSNTCSCAHFKCQGINLLGKRPASKQMRWCF